MIPVYNKIICQIRIIARHCEFSCVFPASTANWLNHLLWSPGSQCTVFWKGAGRDAWNLLCGIWHQKIRLEFVCCQPYGERRICTPVYLPLVIFFLWILGIVFPEVFDFTSHWFPKCTHLSHVPVVIFVLRTCRHFHLIIPYLTGIL